MRFFIGTAAHNQHLQNIAGSLYERGVLGEYHSAGVDVWRSPLAQRARKLAESAYPAIGLAAARRRIITVPESVVSAEWGWEACRLVSRRLGFGELLVDWLWEQSEHSIDRHCAGRIGGDEFDAFLGAEHGALRTITRARSLGKVSVVAYLSPHHKVRSHWVDSEYQRLPELLTPETKRLLDKGRARDARRDEEARLCDVIHCASRLTRDSLVAAGIPKQKIMVVPLGCPTVHDATANRAAGRVRFLYSGLVSVGKGALVLLDAWKLLRPGSSGELHFFGAVSLPSKCTQNAGDNVFFHGPVSSHEIDEEYSASSVLVFPTLLDGFGMVVAEAFSHGLPVIVTTNAGAADLVVDGENGWLVPPRNPEALADRMRLCLSRPELLERMRGSATNTARCWTWGRFRESFFSSLSEKLASQGVSLEPQLTVAG
jgi:glycosyltransferase involved in cell wall biosynthesis